MKTRMRVLAGAVLLGAMVSAYAAPVWQEGSTYTAGTVVSYNGQDYTALVTHTAYIGTGWNPAASPTLWKATGNSTPTTAPTAIPTAVPTPTPLITPKPSSQPTCQSGAVWNGSICAPVVTPTATPTPTPPVVTAPPASNAWDKSVAYTGGQRVSYNGQLYEAKWWTQGDVPGSSEWGPWKSLGQQPTLTPTPVITPTPVQYFTKITGNFSGIQYEWQQDKAKFGNQAPAWLAILGGKVVYSGQAAINANNAASASYNHPISDSVYSQAAICIDPQPLPAVVPEPPRSASNCGVFYQTNITINMPSKVPTPTPTHVPTSTPTVTPTVAPTTIITPTVNPSVVPSYTPGTIPSKAQADALEVELTKDAPAYVKLVKETQRVIDDSIVDQVAPLAATNPDNVKRVERIVPAARFDYLFAIRNAKYSYSNFLKAVAKFPAFCQTYSDGRNSDAICSKLLATMFAHMVQETGANTTWLDGIGAIDTPKWRQGLYWVEEVAYQNNPNLSGYTDSCGDPYWGKIWTCPKRADGQYNSYHGRGAHQLTHHYNYAPFSKVLYGDPNVLLQDPKRVADTWLNLASSVFFMLETQPPKPAMIHVIDGSWVPNAVDQANGLTASFGTTINIINGGFECSKGAETSQAQNRIYAYQNFAQELGVPVAANEQLGCASQKQFSEGGAASFPLYWDKDWGWQRDYMCKPVNYQTGFRTISKGDYAKCVEFIWNVQVK